MPRPTTLRGTAMLFALSLAAIPASADETGRIEIGAQAGVTLAAGVPANDMPGARIFGQYRLNDRWSVGLAVDFKEFDYEDPARRLGIATDPATGPVDAKAEAMVFSALVERTFAGSPDSREWFLGAAVGVADTDVPDVTGPTATGGTFDIRTEVDREVIASLLGGVRQRLGERWFVQFTLVAEQHFAAWEPEDRVSGATGRHGDYFAYGGYLGFGYRF